MIGGRHCIKYFYKIADGTKVADSLNAAGYLVITSERQGSAPTNAIWWGSGIELKDVQFIAYTLINKGFQIRYIGQHSRPGEIQIGGRPNSLIDPAWTVEKVRALTQLPPDNEGNK